MNTAIESVGLVNPSELESKVKDMYTEVACFPDKRYHFEMGESLALRLGYEKRVLDLLPNEAIESFAGVGYHFDMANLQPGETVIDLGSGSGMDVFYAASKVGIYGKVIGIDMTNAQLEKSISLSNRASFHSLYFQKAYIEELPIISEVADIVISNGVINLSANKEKVLQEAARVLKPGGRLVISDIVSMEFLPKKITCNSTLWAACIGGAIPLDSYIRLIEKAGLRLQSTKTNPYTFLSPNAKRATEKFGIQSVSFCAIK